MGLAHLLGLSSAVLGSTLVASFAPLYAPLSERTLEAVSLLSCGILPGAALAVVIPEGVAALFRARNDAAGDDAHQLDDDDMTAWIGAAMLAGFLVMYLMDSVHGHDNYVDPTPHHHPHYSAAPAARHYPGRRPGFRPSPSHLAELEPLGGGGGAQGHRDGGRSYGGREGGYRDSDGDADDLLERGGRGPQTEADATPRGPKPFDWERSFSSASTIRAQAACEDAGQADDDSRHHHHIMKADASSVSTVVGLVAHSLADGISLGASSLPTSSASSSILSGSGPSGGGSSLQLVVFIAIMLHKAPTAFALSTLLSSSPANSRTFTRRALLLFALAAPAGALLTYALLSLLGDQAGGTTEWWAGLALVFSGGTFLFVATHALREQEKREERQEEEAAQRQRQGEQLGGGQGSSGGQVGIGHKTRLALVLVGMALPAVLSRLVGHGH